MNWGLRQRLTLTVAIVMVVSMSFVGLWRIQGEKRERLQAAIQRTLERSAEYV